MKRVIALIGLFFMGLPALLMAQEQGTYIENLGAQDSSYMEEDLVTATEKATGSNSTLLIVIFAVIIIAIIAYLILKKKKK